MGIQYSGAIMLPLGGFKVGKLITVAESNLSPVANTVLWFDSTSITDFTDSTGNHTFSKLVYADSGGDVTVNSDTPLYTSGGANLNFTDGGYLKEAYSTDFAFDTDDFTVETFVYLKSYTGSWNTLFCLNGTYGSRGMQVMINNNGILISKGGSGTNGNYWVVTTNESIGNPISHSLNTWYHIAVSRSSGTLRAFINGSMILETAWGLAYGTKTDHATNYTALGIQNGYDGYNLDGYLEDFRVVKGNGIYTENFTV